MRDLHQEHGCGGKCGCHYDRHHGYDHGSSCDCGHDQHDEHDHGPSCSCGHEHHTGEVFPWSLLIAIGIFLAGVIVLAIVALPAWVQGLWMGASALLPLRPVLKEAAEELRSRSVGENTLLVAALVAAFAIGEWVEGALVLLLFSLGEWLEGKAMTYSRRRIGALAAVTPDRALLLSPDGTTQEVEASAVMVGDRLLVVPFARVPVDCRVLEGASAVDTSSISGESAPVAVEPGAELLSGVLNGSGQLTVEALRPSRDSAAMRILTMVEDAVGRKGRSERFITRFARLYTPVVMALAMVVAVLPPLVVGGWFTWLYRALVFLVASCPCALVISVPLGFYAGIAAAARQGVLLKGGCYVESLAAVDVVAFDKTGTLTTGNMTLTSVISGDKVFALSLAAALEAHSNHPVARAICAAAANSVEVSAVSEHPGIGVEATWEGKPVACGGLRMVHRCGASVPENMAAADAYLLVDGQVVAAFTVASQLQPGAEIIPQAMSALKIDRLVMLTGDRQQQALAVAASVGLSSSCVQAELLPEEKLAAVYRLQGEGHRVAFVGDGINDAPVLAAADVGVAMGLGSPAAIETADAVLVTEGLSRLPGVIKLCRRVVRTVRTNIVFALGIKAAVLLLAVCGIAPMWLAVFADMGVTLLAVANSLRLLLNGF